VKLHFELGDTRVLPEWLDPRKHAELRLLIAPTTGFTPSRRETVKAQNVRDLKPTFNYLPKLDPAA